MALNTADKLMYTIWLLCMVALRYVPCFELGERLELALFMTVLVLLYTAMALWEELNK